MREIHRAGLPTVKKLRYAVTWAVPLDSAPSRAWEVLFRQPDTFTHVCHPNGVRIEGHLLVFDSDEEHLWTWLQYIDAWIASANERLLDRQLAGYRVSANGMCAAAAEPAEASASPRG